MSQPNAVRPPEQEADALERIKAHLDTLYEAGEDCIHPDTGDVVSDPEYDRLVARLKEIRPDSAAFKTPTTSGLESAAKKVRHNPPMVSLEKVIGSLDKRREGLGDWLEGCRQSLGYHGRADECFTQAWKLDGVACALYYEKGRLVRAGLRPRNGVDGEDVTGNIIYVEGVKERLPEPVTCSIRGEIICRKSVFEKKNAELAAAGEKTFANPRNYATGSIRQFKKPEITKDRGLSFIGYSIHGLDNPPYKTERERAKWCNQKLGVPFVRVEPLGHTVKDSGGRKGRNYEWVGVVEALNGMEQLIPDVDFEVDGVVIAVDNLEDQEQLGTHGDTPTGNPRGKIAWKFAEEVAVATVKDVEWGVGRTGKLTPVLTFVTPVQLAGTSVSFCTGHNLGYMKKHQIGPGTVIEVVKAGKIIPKVHGVVSGKTPVRPPHNCPKCGSRLETVAGTEADKESLVCPNEFCGERAVAHLVHYLQVFGVKGLSDATVGKLHEAKLVTVPADFYRLTVDQLIRLDGEDPADPKKEFRSQFLTVARIHMIDAPDKIKDKKRLSDAIEQASKRRHQVPLWQFLCSLGIPGAGKSSGRALETHFKSLDGIRTASVEELTDVEDVGDKTALAIFDFFRANQKAVDALLQYVEPVLPKVGKLTGKTFVFTGGFPEGKEHWMKQVEERGGQCAGSVSKRTDFVVVGADAGSKERKADELGIPKLTLDGLKKML